MLKLRPTPMGPLGQAMPLFPWSRTQQHQNTFGDEIHSITGAVVTYESHQQGLTGMRSDITWTEDSGQRGQGGTRRWQTTHHCHFGGSTHAHTKRTSVAALGRPRPKKTTTVQRMDQHLPKHDQRLTITEVWQAVHSTLQRSNARTIIHHQHREPIR